MNIEELVKYWTASSDKDFKTMKHLCDTKDYHWALFMGHIVIEKLIKAVYASKNRSNPYAPNVHDLLYLSQKAEIDVTPEQEELLDVVTTFNINARYPDYKKEFYKRCNKKYTDTQIKNIEELRKWLKKLLIKK